MPPTPSTSQVTYRSVGKDFTGSSNSLEDREKATQHARDYLRTLDTPGKEVTVFFIGSGCLPVVSHKVRLP